MEASTNPLTPMPDSAIVWHQDKLYLLDQRLLPHTETFLTLTTAAEVAQAIRDMVVRGAPAIGVTAAYGVVLAARQHYAESGPDWQHRIRPELDRLRAARPTAVNLSWAIDRMSRLIDQLNSPADPEGELLQEAKQIHHDDVQANRIMGELGAGLIKPGSGVITHCNAGALATGGYGTALGVIRSGHAAGKIKRVYADETRPWLQGARLTAWELLKDGIPVTLLADGAAAHRMAQGGIDWIIVGSDRIAANGDVANKIGTYALALAARYHGVKVMVVAPTSTIDMNCPSGSDIPIEQRDQQELLRCGDRSFAAPGAGAWNPVFDVTPASCVDYIVTEAGIVDSPNTEKMRKLMD